MKTNILLFLMLLFASQLVAQTKTPSTTLPFQKGKFLVGADFNGAYSSLNGFELKSDARLGYFVLKGLAVGGGISSKIRTFKETAFREKVTLYDTEFAAFARYYIPKAKGLFTEFELAQNLLQYRYKEAPYANHSEWSTLLKYYAGYSILVGKEKKWSIEPKIGYLQSFSKDRRNTTHAVDLKIGFRYFFGKKKKEQVKDIF